MNRTINPRRRAKLIEQAQFKCQKCGKSGNLTCLEIDHIIPIAKGGNNNIENLQVLCYECNMKKFDKLEMEQINKSPREKLEDLKRLVEEYKDLEWPEFKLINELDNRLKSYGIGTIVLQDYFLKIKGINRDVDSKIAMKSRDKLIRHIYNNLPGTTYDDIARIGDISIKTVYRAIKSEDWLMLGQ